MYVTRRPRRRPSSLGFISVGDVFSVGKNLVSGSSGGETPLVTAYEVEDTMAGMTPAERVRFQSAYRTANGRATDSAGIAFDLSGGDDRKATTHTGIALVQTWQGIKSAVDARRSTSGFSTDMRYEPPPPTWEERVRDTVGIRPPPTGIPLPMSAGIAMPSGDTIMRILPWVAGALLIRRFV